MPKIPKMPKCQNAKSCLKSGKKQISKTMICFNCHTNHLQLQFCICPHQICFNGMKNCYHEERGRTGVNFIKILQALFSLISFCQKVTKPNCNERKLCKALSYEKHTHKMLMKLSKEGNVMK
jgi:hypothetical protein